jgi:hypothetical protein
MKKSCRKLKKASLKRPSLIISCPNILQSNENSVTTASSSPTVESFYTQAKNAEFIQKNLEKAEELYRLAILHQDRVESAIKDLASLLHQKNRTLEAIDLLKSNKSLFTENPNKYQNLLISLENQLKCKNFLSKTIKISNLESTADQNFINNLFSSKCRIEKFSFASEIEDGRLIYYCIVYFPSHSSARKALTGFLDWNRFCVEWVSDYFEVICDAHYARQKIVNHRKTTPTFDYVLFERETREFLYSQAIDAKYIAARDDGIERPEELLGFGLFNEIFVV